MPELPLDLRLCLAATRRLPPLPRMVGVANHLVRPLWRWRRPGLVQADVLGARMALDPAEHVDGLMLWVPQLLDRRERAFLHRFSRPGDAFLDAGAYLGLYALDLARAVGPTGVVVAVEAHSPTAARLRQHLATAPSRVVVVDAALGAATGTARLAPPPPGNAGHRVLGAVGEPVQVLDWAALRARAGVDRFHTAKLDLEGGEAPIVAAALAEPASQWPRAWVLEVPGHGPAPALDRLAHAGYATRRVGRNNALAWRDP